MSDEWLNFFLESCKEIEACFKWSINTENYETFQARSFLTMFPDAQIKWDTFKKINVLPQWAKSAFLSNL